MENFTLHCGDKPLLISLPHDGTGVPGLLSPRLTPAARRVPDTDWHVGLLYGFAKELGASMIVPRWSRYVVDLNRPPDGHALYPGRNETALVPVSTFAGESIYLDGREPTSEEILARVDWYWRPYHSALQNELHRLRDEHGRVVLWDGHSIKSRVPMFFDGQLPDFNLGTADGASFSPTLQERLTAVLRERARGGQDASDYSHIVNGRFKGGYITRHYGKPDDGIDAVQLELAQCTYMDEDSFDYQPDRAVGVQRVIHALLEACVPL
ncbi:MAG: N-formylglutamate deformylase [Rhodanobacteraceae bacterium]